MVITVGTAVDVVGSVRVEKGGEAEEEEKLCIVVCGLLDISIADVGEVCLTVEDGKDSVDLLVTVGGIVVAIVDSGTS